jgi:DNA replication and repair protein RecF
MHLRKLELDEFRSFRKLSLNVDPHGFRLIGENASGKSTLLEAIAMLATTRSPRTSAEKEIAHWQSGEELAVPPYSRLHGVFDRLDGRHAVDIGISVDERGTGALRKQVRFDERPVRAVDAVGQFNTVFFSPEDVDLISGPPAARRRYLDMAISQASRPYLKVLSRFSKVLEQRNSLLRAFSRDRATSTSRRQVEELAFWDSELTATGAEVLAVRLEAVRALSAKAGQHFAQLSGDGSLAVAYVSGRLPLPDYEASTVDWRSPPQALRQMLSASLSGALNAVRDEELRRGVTVIGPHRDDFTVMAQGSDLGRYGSRGQQRLALIALKIAELELLSDAAGEAPVLLLDDILSELDAGHRAKVIGMLSGRSAQICVTSTDVADLGSADLAHLPILRASAGTIEPLMGESSS